MLLGITSDWGKWDIGERKGITAGAGGMNLVQRTRAVGLLIGLVDSILLLDKRVRFYGKMELRL